jgi:hypothetical protein
VALLFATEDDPLFLQVKEARDSVLAPYVDFKGFGSNGERVVFGQRLMQAASDVFLGHRSARWASTGTRASCATSRSSR